MDIDSGTAVRSGMQPPGSDVKARPRGRMGGRSSAGPIGSAQNPCGVQAPPYTPSDGLYDIEDRMRR